MNDKRQRIKKSEPHLLNQIFYNIFYNKDINRHFNFLIILSFLLLLPNNARFSLAKRRPREKEQI